MFLDFGVKSFAPSRFLFSICCVVNRSTRDSIVHHVLIFCVFTQFGNIPKGQEQIDIFLNEKILYRAGILVSNKILQAGDGCDI